MGDLLAGKFDGFLFSSDICKTSPVYDIFIDKNKQKIVSWY